MSKPTITHSEFSKQGFFQECCERAGVKPSKRQAAKFRMRKGLAHEYRKAVDATQLS